MDTDSVVIAGRREKEIEEGIVGTNGDGWRLDLGGVHTTRCTDDVL